MTDNLTIEGEPDPKPFKLVQVDSDGNFVSQVGEYVTLEEMRAVRRRLDWHYAEYEGRRKLAS